MSCKEDDFNILESNLFKESEKVWQRKFESEIKKFSLEELTTRNQIAYDKERNK